VKRFADGNAISTMAKWRTLRVRSNLERWDFRNASRRKRLTAVPTGWTASAASPHSRRGLAELAGRDLDDDELTLPGEGHRHSGRESFFHRVWHAGCDVDSSVQHDDPSRLKEQQ